MRQTGRRKKLTALLLTAAMVITGCPSAFAASIAREGAEDVEGYALINEEAHEAFKDDTTTHIQLGVSLNKSEKFFDYNGVSKNDVQLTRFSTGVLQKLYSDRELMEAVYNEVTITNGTQDVTKTVSSGDLDYSFFLVTETQREEYYDKEGNEKSIKISGYVPLKKLSTSDNTLEMSDDHKIIREMVSVNEIYACVGMKNDKGGRIWSDNILRFGFIPDAEMDTLYVDTNTTVSENLGDYVIFFPKALGLDKPKKLNEKMLSRVKLYNKDDYAVNGSKASEIVVKKIVLANAKKNTVNADGTKSAYVKKDSKQAYIKSIKLEKEFKQYKKTLNAALKAEVKKIKTLPFADTGADRSKGDGAGITVLIYPVLLSSAVYEYEKKIYYGNTDKIKGLYTRAILHIYVNHNKNSTAKLGKATISGSGQKLKVEKKAYNPSTKKDIYKDNVSYVRKGMNRKKEEYETVYPIFRGVNRCCGWSTGDEEVDMEHMCEIILEKFKS